MKTNQLNKIRALSLIKTNQISKIILNILVY